MAAEVPDVTAAELALGLLDGEDRVAALRRVLAEPGFAQAVSWWREQFGLMAEGAEEIPPPADMFVRIMAMLEHRSANPLEHAVPGGRIRRWQIATAVASAVSAVCVAALLLRSAQTSPVTAPQHISSSPILIAQLAAAGKPVALAAAYDPAHRSLKITRSGSPLARGHGEELWVIAGKDPPRPIGMIGPADETLQLSSTNSVLIREGAKLAVSIEPPMGSPTGRPTGPIVASGFISKI